ncbi:uncharacterized protein METZ01_LOCUS481781, partial [marine metagenome]
ILKWVLGLVSGLAVLPKVSAKNLDLKLNTVTNLKTTAAELIINYPASFQSLAQSVLIDNQDAANPVTVRLNRQTNVISIGGGNFRAFNDAWIEQLNLTGASTNTQVTAQISPLQQISIYGAGVTN